MAEPEVRGPSACDPAAWDFARVEAAWALFAPLTPRGKDEKEARTVLSDRAEIERRYDETEWAAAALAALDSPGRDRLTHCLGRVPRLPDIRGAEGGRSLGDIDVFLVKKFLSNYRAVLGLLDEGSRERFSLSFESEALFALLSKGGSDEESFFVSDAYEPGLAGIRARIRSADAEIALLRAASERAAEAERGLDFRGRGFLVLPAEEARALLACDGEVRFSVEHYDSASCVARILPGEGELRAEAEREGLLAEERIAESEALSRLSEAIGSDARLIAGYELALRRFDLARARASLAETLSLTRPIFGSGRLSIVEGRFLPCEDECGRRGLRYRPLDLELDERAALIFGSNMGGKTVALQTALCLQILAQAGLFAPAGRFETEAYARIVYAGAPRPGGLEPGAEDDGLSGFGREVDALEKAWRAAEGGGAFVVLDELGRTTSSPEAEALVAATAEAFAAAVGTRCLLSSHFRGAAPSKAVARLRMAGLDREAARAAASRPGLSPAERIREIGALMRYEILREAEPSRTAKRREGPLEGEASSDALEVAALLGLDEGILKTAREYYSARRDGREGDRG